MVTLTVKKADRNWNVCPSVETITEHVIEAATEDELFTQYFKDWDNRYKYCNDLRLSIVEDEQRERYHAWIGDVSNYVRIGGDMW